MPILSIIVIFHNMRREAQRTLFSLSTMYQNSVNSFDYDVIAIDNNSSQELTSDMVQSFGPNFRYRFFETASVSPAEAVNVGVDMANGKYVAVIVDGARIATPGLIRKSLNALKIFPSPFVCTLAWHLGYEVQNKSIETGYNQLVEDELLKSINWRPNGYRLFDVSTLAQSSNVGFLGGLPTECSWFAMPRSVFKELGGFDERFRSPGGGLVNHDFLNRVKMQANFDPVVLLGEGTFHQVHGGIASNAKPDKHPVSFFQKEYQRIHGKSFKKTDSGEPHYFGQMPKEALRFVTPKN